MKKLTRFLWAAAVLCLLVSPGCSKKEEAAQADPNWEKVLSFDDDPLIESIQSLAVFKDQLFVGASDYYYGGTVWSSKDGKKWSRVSEPGFGTKTNYMITSLYVFQDRLYAGTGCPTWHNHGDANTDSNCGKAMLYRTADGKKWEAVETAGFGYENEPITTLAEFQDSLYAGTNNSAGSQIWRSRTGTPGDWEQVKGDFLANNSSPYLIVFKDQLYVNVNTG